MSASSAVVTDGLDRLGWTVGDLWVAAIAIGGGFSHRDIVDLAIGTKLASQVEHDILAAALNGGFTDRGEDSPIAYWVDLPEAGP